MINAIHAISFGLVTSALIAIGAIGFTLQFGVTNVINIAYGNIMTVGAFASLIMDRLGLGLLVTIIAAPVAGAIVTWLLAVGVLRPFSRRNGGPFDLIMVTLALSLIVEYTIGAATENQQFILSLPSGGRVQLGALIFTGQELTLIAVAGSVFVLTQLTLRFTRVGKAIRALSADPKLARACGIPVRTVVNLNWVVTGALAGSAGLVYVLNSFTLTSESGTTFLVLVIAAAMLGGAGSPTGAVIASLIVGIATEEVATFGGSFYSQAAGLGILALVLVVRPAARTWGSVLQGEVTV